MNIRDMALKWEEKRAEYRAISANVSADALLGAILTDLKTVESDMHAATGSLIEAAEYSGLHPDSISRRIRKGQLKNYGTRARPRVRFSDLAPKAQPTGAETPAKTPVASIGKSSHPSAPRTAGNLALDVSASRRA